MTKMESEKEMCKSLNHSFSNISIDQYTKLNLTYFESKFTSFKTGFSSDFSFPKEITSKIRPPEPVVKSNNIRERSAIYDILLNQLKYIGNGQNGGTLPDYFIW